MDPDSSRLRIAVTDARGRSVRAAGLSRWLASVAPPRARGTLAIALVSDAAVRDLNRRYRRRDQLTDVLAFPATVHASPSPARRTTRHDPHIPASARYPTLLGDIVIATGVARRQAAAAGHSYTAELRVLALHGLLHLLGYDHHHPTDRVRMRRAEARLRRKGGLAAGLIERAGTAGLRTARSGGRR